MPNRETPVKIFHFEDEALARELVKDIVTHHGHSYDSHPDNIGFTPEAILKLGADIILHDGQLPGTHGLEMLINIAQHPDKNGQVLVYASGDPLPADKGPLCAELGINILTKPFNVNAVLAIIQQAKEAKKQARTGIRDKERIIFSGEQTPSFAEAALAGV